MTIEMIKSQLRELIKQKESLMISNPENVEIYVKDINALECAIDAVEFVEESAGGKEYTAYWSINCDGYYPFCSECGKEPPGREMTRYCPNCGRKMVTRRKETKVEKRFEL